MKRVKIHSRSTIISHRLNIYLMLFFIERETSGIHMDNPFAVIDEFASIKNRKLEFSLLFFLKLNRYLL